jgi:thiazole synthase ThiGH ThiG subunit
MRAGIEAGRDAYLAGRIEKRAQASPSSPTTGISR